MRKQDVTLIKLGGNVITRKRDDQRIQEYLASTHRFMEARDDILEFQAKISNLLDFTQINKIFSALSGHLGRNPDKKMILFHGAGSIGHPLVSTIAKDVTTLQTILPIIKLAVGIQNQILVANGIQAGLPLISMSSHQLFHGVSTPKKAVARAMAPNLTVLEDLIRNSNVIPMFYGDMGYTDEGWRVFSGDIIPSALMDRVTTLRLTKAIFITNVLGKKVGIYTKNPDSEGAEYIKRIEVFSDRFQCYAEDRSPLEFESGDLQEGHDVTEAMEGKLRNIIHLARGYVECVVTGVEDFPKVLKNNASVGTVIAPQTKPRGNLAFLGTGDAFAASGFKSAGIFFEFESKGILLDCGPHALQALKATGRISNDIDIILITHFHGDHLAGVPFVLLETRNIQPLRTKPLTILGPPQIQSRVNEMFVQFYGDLAKAEPPYPCHYVEITQTTPFNGNGIVINAIPLAHTPEAQGYRVETPFIKLAYSGDTGWTENLINLVKGTDLAVVECKFFTRELPGVHLNFAQARKLKVHTKRLVLTHLGEEARRHITEIITSDDDILIPLEGQEIQI